MKNQQYRPDIDGLRAFAVLAVIAFHLFGVRGGYVGVDIFFVISGFLITKIILSESKSNSFTFFNFYSRRIKRIFPALLIVLLCVFLAGVIFFLSEELKFLTKHIVAGSIFSSNILLWFEAGYFDQASHYKPLLHLWSLGVEEQFYIVWPLILITLLKLRLNLIYSSLFLILISFLLNIYWIQFDADASFYLFFSRAWQLILGALAAFLLIENSIESYLNRNLLIANLFSGLGAVLCIFAIIVFKPDFLYPGYWALLPTLGTFLIILGGAQTVLNQYILSKSLMVKVGLISFPLYLWHWPIFSFMKILNHGEVTNFWKLIALVLSFILAFATYVFLEKKIRYKKSNLVTLILLALMICLALFSTFVFFKDGFNSRWPAYESKYELIKKNDSRHDESLLKKCKKTFIAQKFAGECSTNNPDAEPEVILIGDSHAISIASGLAYYYDQHGQTFMLLARGACVPLIDTETTRPGKADVCKDIFDEIYEYIKSNKSIKLVILTFRGPWYLSGGGNSYHKQPRNPLVLNKSIKQGYIDTFSALHAVNKRLLVLDDVPEFSFMPKECVSYRPIISKYNPIVSCEADRIYSDSIRAEYSSVLQEIKVSFGYKVIDPMEIFCNEDKCTALNEYGLLFKDDNHLSINGSFYYADRLFKQYSDLLLLK
jgi:peptidoglycan/LPS O-acetylase OafA/YrhL